MDGIVRHYNRVVRSYDRELYAQRSEDGLVSILRKNFRYVAYDIDGASVHVLTPSPEFVFALTDNWTKRGQPRQWPADDVLFRIREIDHWAKQDLMEELERQNEEIEKKKRRHIRNEMEAFASDFRKDFARATNDINVSILDKSEKRRRIRDGKRQQKF